MPPDHRQLLIHWACKPDNLWDASQLLPRKHSEELKISFLVPLQILRRPAQDENLLKAEKTEARSGVLLQV
ncbi:hypothetical protein CHARACLAT_009749 [Characodon lateralis]|uniref:Uncharacterized protein n=1 Tax=Characodon lateralis TaxID=208331 RepID=A0ABU7CLX1_9TELE|nr:hypothetical protein [Characodon lateralis]